MSWCHVSKGCVCDLPVLKVANGLPWALRRLSDAASVAQTRNTRRRSRPDGVAASFSGGRNPVPESVVPRQRRVLGLRERRVAPGRAQPPLHRRRTRLRRRQNLRQRRHPNNAVTTNATETHQAVGSSKAFANDHGELWGKQRGIEKLSGTKKQPNNPQQNHQPQRFLSEKPDETHFYL